MAQSSLSNRSRIYPLHLVGVSVNSDHCILRFVHIRICIFVFSWEFATIPFLSTFCRVRSVLVCDSICFLYTILPNLTNICNKYV